jgi:DNA-binding SARP family transcriptional activator
MQTTAPLTLRFLGEPQVLRGESVLPLPPSKKTRALLAYLALHSKPFRRDTLCELLWEIPDDPKGSLRWSLSKLRRLVDDECHTRIIADRIQVSFDSSDARIDCLELQALLAKDLQQLDTETLKDACQYFSGKFLEGLDFPNFPEFYLWCIAEREKVIQGQAQLLSSLIDRLDTEAAIPYARTLINLVPAEQDYHIVLLGLLTQSRRAQEAKRQLDISIHMLHGAGQSDFSALHLALRQSTTDGDFKKDTSSVAEDRASPTTIKPLTQQTVSGFQVSIEDALNYSRRKIVGREQEIKTLVSGFKDCVENKLTKVFLVRGDPGIGKSCLLHTVTRLAQKFDGWLLHADTYESEIIRPFSLWNDAYRRSSQLAVPTVLAVDENSSRDKIFAGLSDNIAKLANQKPVIIIFDDVQWCDESSAAALHYVLRMNRHKPVFCVIAAREQELQQNQAVLQTLSGLRGDRLLHTLKLDPLAPNNLQLLIASLYPTANAEVLSRECGGNPLLAIELARAASEGGQGRSLHDLISARMSRLDLAVVEVLQWAAVLEPRLEIKTLKRVTGFELDAIEKAIDCGEQQGILRASSRGLHFSHDLIGHSIYQQLTLSRRRIMHQRVAEILELDAALDLQHAAELAHHAEKSGNPTLAARALVSAGCLCMRFFANDEAKSLAEKGLVFARQLEGVERVCLSLDLSEILWTCTSVKDWRQAAEESVGLAESALDYGALPYARLGYQLAAYLRWLHGDWNHAQRNSLQAERITRGGSDADQILGMAEAAKCLALLEKDLSQADAMIMEARSLAKRKHVHLPVIATALGILAYHANDLDLAVEHLEEARASYKANGDRINEFLVIEYLVMIEIERDNFIDAKRRCQQLLILGENLKDSSECPCARALDALCHYAIAGDDQPLKKPTDELRIYDAKHRLGYILIRAALIDVRKSRPETALARGGEALDYTELLQRPSEQMLAHLVLALANQQLQRDDVFDLHLAAMQELDKQPVANWARQRASQSLAEFE